MPLLPAPSRLRAARGGWLRLQRGLSLMELLVVMGLVSVLAGLAVPALGSLLLKRQVESAAEALVSDLRLARSEAIRRAAVVTLCSSTDGTACSDDAAWSQGWLVFADTDANQQRESGEALIRVQATLPGVASVGSAQPLNDKAAFSFHPTGWARAASQTLLFRSTHAGTAPRVVCISNQGRPALRPASVVQCS